MGKHATHGPAKKSVRAKVIAKLSRSDASYIEVLQIGNDFYLAMVEAGDQRTTVGKFDSFDKSRKFMEHLGRYMGLPMEDL